jgi:pentatricopeptide repeat protein
MLPRHQPSPPLSQVIWATLVDGAVRAGDLGAGEALLARMRASGCAPNDYIFNSLLRGVCSRGGPPEARPAVLRLAGAPRTRRVRLCLCPHLLGAPGGVTPYKYPNPPPACWLLRPPKRLHTCCDVLGRRATGAPTTRVGPLPRSQGP